MVGDFSLNASLTIYTNINKRVIISKLLNVRGEYSMRIHIIGGSGTGKSYLANVLSTQYRITHYDLDNLFWDNSSDHYGVKTPVDKRDRMLHDILKKESWILEGVYYSWLDESFEKADAILILDIPKRVYQSRIIRRFIKRKLGIEQGKKETIKSLIDLLKWTNHFQSNMLPNIHSILSKYKDKVIVLDSVKKINEYISHDDLLKIINCNIK